VSVQTCPNPDDLQLLLTSDLPHERVAELESHLAACPECQQALECLATGGGEWCSELRDLKSSQPTSESAYWPALKRVQVDLNETLLPGTSLNTPRPEAADVVKSAHDLKFLSPPDKPGYIGKIQDFDVLEVIGHGGMGVVLRAFDTCLERFVAIKVLCPILATNDIAHARFCREARAAASISHENVVAIYQVMEIEEANLPLLVMQLVSGESLQQRLDRGSRLSVREIVSLGAQIAAGLAAAHERGLVHRDVKPGNILLEKDGTRVKITDFGLVRAVEDVKLTQTGFVGGTPLYMAPEQARGDAIDHRTDLFSLGAVLYAMASGEPPFSDTSPFLVLQRVTQTPHRPVRELNPEVPGWLADVIDRLLAKKPDDRIQTAAEVAEILQLHHAAMVSSGTVKCVKGANAQRRSSLTYLGVGLAAGALLTAGAMLAANSIWRSGPRGPAAVASGGGDPSASPAVEPLAVLSGNTGPIWTLAHSPSKDELVVGLDDGTFRLWDLKNKSVRATQPAHRAPIFSIAYSQSGNRIATGSDDGTAKVWDAESLDEIASIPLQAAVRTVAFLPGGERIAIGTRTGAVEIYNIEDQEQVISTAGHAGAVIAVAVSPDGKLVASASSDKTVRVWDAATGNERLKLDGNSGGVYSVAFSPDSKSIVAGGWDRKVRLWDVSTGNLLETLEGHQADIWTVAWDGDGKFASAGEDHALKIWQRGEKEPLVTYDGHKGTIYSIVFAPDGKTIASGGRDGAVRIWPMPK
jgi:WD40 repeat protein